MCNTLAINLDSPANRTDTTSSSDMTFMLFLEGYGYLSNDTPWQHELDIGLFLELQHFNDENIAFFDDAPFDLVGRMNPNFAHLIRIHRRVATTTITALIEEIIL